MDAIMQQVPTLLGVLFGAVTGLSVFLFVRATADRRRSLVLLAAWAVITGVLAWNGFFLRTDVLPPRFMLAIGPPLLTVVLLFVLPAGRRYLDGSNGAGLTLLHAVRVPVELVLFTLFTHKAVPELMTFTGRNWDILSGITALPVWYFGYKRKVIARAVLILWNLLCLGLLFNIVINAVLAAPFPFQQQAFEQSNVAVLFFPYIWLPAIVVPLVLLAHLATLRELVNNKRAHG